MFFVSKFFFFNAQRFGETSRRTRKTSASADRVGASTTTNRARRRKSTEKYLRRTTKERKRRRDQNSIDVPRPPNQEVAQTRRTTEVSFLPTFRKKSKSEFTSKNRNRSQFGFHRTISSTKRSKVVSKNRSFALFSHPKCFFVSKTNFETTKHRFVALLSLSSNSKPNLSERKQFLRLFITD